VNQETETVAEPAASSPWTYPPFVPPVIVGDVTDTPTISAEAPEAPYVEFDPTTVHSTPTDAFAPTPDPGVAPVPVTAEDKAAAAREARQAKQEKKRREVGMKPRVLAACGTPAAYRRHLRLNEPVDDLCRTEWNRAARERRALAKTAAAEKAAAEAAEQRRQLDSVAGVIHTDPWNGRRDPDPQTHAESAPLPEPDLSNPALLVNVLADNDETDQFQPGFLPVTPVD